MPVEQLGADRVGPVRRARAPGGLPPNPLCGSAPHEAGQERNDHGDVRGRQDDARLPSPSENGNSICPTKPQSTALRSRQGFRTSGRISSSVVGLALVSLSNHYDQMADSVRTGDYAERALARVSGFVVLDMNQKTSLSPRPRRGGRRAQLLFPCYDGLATVHLDLGDEGQAEESYVEGPAGLRAGAARLDSEALVVLPFLD